MRLIDALRARIALLFGDRAESRTRDEIAFHVDMEADRLMREGLEPAEARRRALVAFGGVTRHAETLREGRGLAWFGGLSLDARLAVRMLAKHPALGIVSIIGIGAAVAIGATAFSAILAIAGGTLPLPDGDRVIAIRNVNGIRSVASRTHLHDLPEWRRQLKGIDAMGAYRTIDRNLVLGGRGQSIRVAEISAAGFRVAPVKPIAGRTLVDTDELPASAPVVVIGARLWRDRFDSRPDILGHVVQLGDSRYTIVGVMPEGFLFPVRNEIWTPLRLNPLEYPLDGAPSVQVFARLGDGVTLQDVQRQLETIGQRIAADRMDRRARLRPSAVWYTRTFVGGGEATVAFALAQLLVTLLLVVIGMNVAILVYARTASRIGEIAVRTALGASRARIVGQLFAEALALSSLGAALGLLGAAIALRRIDDAVARMSGDQLPFWIRFQVTPGVVVYGVGLAILTAIIVGVFPAMRATRKQVQASLQQFGARSGGLALGRTWTMLIVTQVAVAVAILPVAIAGIARWTDIADARQQLSAKSVLTGRVVLDRHDGSKAMVPTKRTIAGKVANLGSTPAEAFTDSEEVARFLPLRAAMLDRLRAEPGVTRVATSSGAPGLEGSRRFEPDDATRATDAGTTWVDAEYFATYDMPMVAGKPFASSDFDVDRRNVAIINRSLAKRLFDGDPVGRRIREAQRRDAQGRFVGPDAPWETIVGVVPDFPVDSSTPSFKVYRPLPETFPNPTTLNVRLASATAAQFGGRLQAIALETNPMLRVESIKTLEECLDEESAGQRIAIAALELITLATVLLSAAGIYALLSFTITRRRREIGIRAALGAGSTRLVFGVLSRVMLQVGAGILIGIAIAAMLDRSFEGGWTGRRAELVLPGVVVLMTLVGAIAALEPARRAIRVDPTEALRSD